MGNWPSELELWVGGTEAGPPQPLAVDPLTRTPYGAWVDKIVAVKGGRVRGVRRDDLWTFSGIPYGRAPVGALRWRPPEAPEPWDGVRDASSFGPIAPQAAGIPGFAGLSDPQDGELQSEDCLSLNIWTPDVPDRPSRVGARAVMVWIHGGGFTGGSGSNFLYRGAKLARQGDLVVVTINYRLGALGFLGHRALADPDGYVGNWGLHDQVAALEWVRDHIALFGGDSSNVTVFGESAGGFSVATLLGTPGATGLFRRAIVQSGGVHVHTVAEGERTAERVTELLGLTSCDRARSNRCPRKIWWRPPLWSRSVRLTPDWCLCHICRSSITGSFPSIQWRRSNGAPR